MRTLALSLALALAGCAPYDHQPTRLEQAVYNHEARKSMGISDAEWRAAERETRYDEHGWWHPREESR